MFRALFLIFLLIPLLEIYILIKVGGVIGALPTVFLVVFTAVLGAFLLKIQGFSTLRRGRAALAHGEIPAIELLEGMVLVIAGALLLTPGFFTDALGFLALIPPVRRAAIMWFLRHVHVIGPRDQGPRGPRQGPRGGGGNVIDGEYRRDD